MSDLSANRPTRAQRPDLYECEICGPKPGSPALCERCRVANEKAGPAWVGAWYLDPGEDRTNPPPGYELSEGRGIWHWNNKNGPGTCRTFPPSCLHSREEAVAACWRSHDELVDRSTAVGSTASTMRDRDYAEAVKRWPGDGDDRQWAYARLGFAEGAAHARTTALESARDAVAEPIPNLELRTPAEVQDILVARVRALLKAT